MNALVLATALLSLSQSAAPRATVDWLVHGPQEGDALSLRLEAISAAFLDTPYIHSPLGEGEGVDPDPPIRFDAVDCLTFVEQTLALGLAPTPVEVPRLLEALRYGARPVYEDRNHLMEAQWLPNNVRKGFLRDVTRAYGDRDTVRVRKVLSEESWQSGSSRALMLPREAQPRGEFAFDLIPLDKVRRIAGRIPTGTILVVVRADRPNKVTRITHLGFVIQKGRRTRLRHAARGHYARVVDEDLATFLTRNSKYSKWPVEGVALFQPLLPELSAPVADVGEP
ncbi:MAG: N-acetylmuramoyl-L-alanine amidase-like domain-containing protein [Myxococcaceae bacterium]